MDLLRSAQAVMYNTPLAAYVDTSTHTGEVWITGLIPFKAANLVSVKQTVAVAEVQQVLTVGGSAAITVIANTKYQIKLGNVLDREFENTNRLKPYTAVTPAVLTSAAVDRYNLYTRLASRINDDKGANMIAGAKCTFVVDSVTMNFAPPTGTNKPVWVQGTSGTKAFIYFQIPAVAGTPLPNAGTVNGATKTSIVMNIWNGVMPVDNDDFTIVASPVDGSLGTGTAFKINQADCTTNAGQSLVIVDKAGYYAPSGVRHGATSYFATTGFVTSDIVQTVVPKVSSGQGPFMVLSVPVKEVSSDNLVRGQWDFPNPSKNPVSDAPVATNVTTLPNVAGASQVGGYDIFELTINNPVSTQPGPGLSATKTIHQVIYANRGAGAGGSADFQALQTALLAL